MLADVADGRPALSQHGVSVPCLSVSTCMLSYGALVKYKANDIGVVFLRCMGYVLYGMFMALKC